MKLRHVRTFRSAAIALAAIMLVGACSDGPNDEATTGTARQELVTVTLKWANAGVFGAIAPRSDGSAIATAKDKAIAISPSGAMTTLFSGGTPKVQRGSEGFLVPTPKGTLVYDATGTRKGQVSHAINEYVKLIPGGLETFAPRGRSGDPENLDVEEARIFEADGSLVSKFKADDLVQSRLTKSHLFWATRDRIVKSTFGGATEWTLEARAHRFEVDDRGQSLIVNRAGDTRVVEVYEGTKRAGASTFDAPVWNLAIAPSGGFSAASSKTTARLFDKGKLVTSIQLGDVFPTSLDVSDKGYVLVGTQDRRKKISAVTLYTAGGAVAWNKTFGDDDNAYRPDVRFSPDGSGFFVRDRAGLSFFAMVNP